MFKKIILSFVLSLGIFSFAFAQVDSIGEKIEEYRVELEVQENGDLQVKETIDYTFGDVERHGIYRDIPITLKQDRKKVTLEVSNISVQDEKGKQYNFTTSKSNGILQIKIGDPDVLITGSHIYDIEYLVKKPFVFGAEFDRLSWNAIGTEWTVPIEKSFVQVSIPETFTAQVKGIQCFIGVQGSNNKCKMLSKDKKSFDFITGALTREGVTVDLDFQKGVIAPPTQSELFLGAVKKWWPIILPIIFFFFAFRHWRKEGRDPNGRGTIVTQFDAPDKLTPAEVGVVYDEKADNKDIWSEIIYLATQGFLTIEKLETGILSKSDYLLTRKRDEGELTNDFDKILYRGLFLEEEKIASISELFAAIRGKKSEERKLRDSVKLSELKYKFESVLNQIKDTLYEGVATNGYFVSNPEKKRRWYKGFAVFALFFGGWLCFPLAGTDGIVFAVALLFCAPISFLFAWLIPARTQKGVDAFEHIQGLKQYLVVAEKDRINFHNAPEKNPKEFERLLPYAMALGVETKWATQFAGLELPQPSWYVGPMGHGFNAVIFANTLGDFSTQAGNTIGASASSGGGGSVGGGGGGGGGGSW